MDGDYPATQTQHGGRAKLINDPVHGYISLSTDVVKIMDTEQFQRLRDLKQLGTSYHVFPGASHNRFEHCVGTSHLAGKLADRIYATQPDLDLRPRDCTLVKLAGLCHDLGHGPFSHAFEEFLHQHLPNHPWKHEEMSVKMLKFLIDDNALEFER